MTVPLQIIGAIGLVICCILSFFPFSLAKGWKAWPLYLPLIGTLFYGVYEILMPSEINIRVDMAFVLPILWFLGLNGIAKLGVMLAMILKTKKDRQCMEPFHHRKIQVAFTALIFIVCFGWFVKFWWF